MFRNKWMGLLLILILVLMTGCGSKKAETSEDQQLISEELSAPKEGNFKLAEVTRGDYIEEKKTGGALYYPKTRELSFDKDNCEIKDVKASEGDYVKKGDVLITFSSKESAVELEAMELELEQLQNEYEVQKAQKQQAVYDSYKELSGKDSYDYQAGACQYQKQQLELDRYCYQMEAAIEKLEREIKELKKEMKRKSLKAPFDGRISKMKNLRSGDEVKNGEVLVTIQSEEEILVAAENPVNGFGYNQKVRVTFSNRGQEITGNGVVVTSDNILPAESQTGYVIVRMDEEFDWTDVSSWGQVSASVQGETLHVQDVLIVDKNAVALESGNYVVEIYEDGMLHKRYVELGCSNNNGNGDVVWITAGLSGGESLVLQH